MKTLKESILSDMDDVISSGDEVIKDNIKQWLKENLIEGASKCEISKKPNKDGLYEVSTSGNIKFKTSISTLTNNSFIWTKVINNFYCWNCPKLTSLKGAPNSVGGSFICDMCDKLTSLEGAPEIVGGSFICSDCPNLTSLEGAPEIVGKYFSCNKCPKLTSLKGAPKEVGYDFNCDMCVNLVSLEGAPEIVGKYFICKDCGKQFTEQEVRKLCKVQGIIYV